jgi:hypothetical protein
MEPYREVHVRISREGLFPALQFFWGREKPLFVRVFVCCQCFGNWGISPADPLPFAPDFSIAHVTLFIVPGFRIVVDDLCQ